MAADRISPSSTLLSKGVIARPEGPKQSSGRVMSVDADSQKRWIATPLAEARNDNALGLPEFVGGDTFLPEPPLSLVIAGDAILLGGVIVVGAAAIAASSTALASGVSDGLGFFHWKLAAASPASAM